MMHESWRTVSAELMMGDNYVINGKDTLSYEQMRIQKISGHWCFIASLNGGPPTLFSMVKNSPIWVFENKEHDFPQQVVYSQGPNNTLNAWIKGYMDGKEAKVVFDLKRP